MLSFASDADIPPALLLALRSDEASAAEGDDGGVGSLGFHEIPPGLGRSAGAGPGRGPVPAGFSKAAILSRRDPGFGFGGGDGWSDMRSGGMVVVEF